MNEKLKVPFKHYGAKASLAKKIVPHFPEHKVFIEPFCGSAAVLIKKDPSFIEIANDLDAEIINVFHVLQENPFELAALLWASPFSQKNFRTETPKKDLERAAKWIADSVQTYCGDANTSTWAIDACAKPHKPKAKVLSDWYSRLLPLAARLKDVTFTSQCGVEVIAKYGQDPEVLLYVDPPYINHEREFRFRVDYSAMVTELLKAKAKVVISEYPAAIEYFPGFRVIPLAHCGRARTGAHKTKAKTNPEILLCNF